MLTLACENIRFSSLFTSLSGEERGETDVFAGYANFGVEKKVKGSFPGFYFREQARKLKIKCHKRPRPGI